MTDDDKLAARMANGNSAAAEALVAQYYDAILRYCLWHTPSQADAEDATQETFLKVVRFIPANRHYGNLRAWLYQIARHTCIDRARRRTAEMVPLESIDEPAAPDPGYAAVEEADALRQLVATLPEQQRELVLLRFGGGLTLREIAEVTGLPLRTVQSRLRAALKRLRKDFEKGAPS